MDIQLKKMSGIEAISQLKADKILQNIPVIAVTAFAMAEDRVRIEEAGCDGYITKPIYVAAFLQEIRDKLAKNALNN
jgi:two-component system cell cycle response regulator DivK